MFLEIIEEEVDDVIFRVNVIYSGKGVVAIDGVTAYPNQKDVKQGSEVIVSVKPAEGYMLKSILYNGTDVTANVVDNEYVIKSVDTNVEIEVSFEEKPCILSLKSGDGGSLNVSVIKGETFECSLIAEDGWEINTVMFNGMDVTSTVGEDGSFISPTITGNSVLSVSFANKTSVQTVLDDTENIKVYVKEGNIVIIGITDGEKIDLFSASGELVMSVVSTGETAEILTLPMKGVYLVKTSGRCFKVNL